MNLPRPADDLLDLLDRSGTAVGVVVDRVRPQQWSWPTPCTDWSVRQVVGHLVGMNRLFVSMLTGAPRPERAQPSDQALPNAYATSSAALLTAFAAPGVLERRFEGPLGHASGAERLQIRLYDLLAHGWDVAQATEQPDQLPQDAAEVALSFARSQLHDEARPGRFAPAREELGTATAVERLVAFLGRPARPARGDAGKNEA